ncbi:MAG TPA: dockerin type I domain-containing protein [Lacipirellula sp.]
MRFFNFSFALAIWLFATQLHAEFQAEFVQIPINAAAIDDEPDLANAQTWQLRVTADHDILAMELYVQLTGSTFFQSPFGGNFGPVNPLFLPFAPAAEFDTYLWPNNLAGNYGPITGSDYLELYDGPYGFTPTELHQWVFSTTYSTPAATPYAQLTFVPRGEAPIEHKWLARFYERLGPSNVREHIVTFPSDLESPFGGDVNLDFTVNSQDLQEWVTNYGQSGDLPENRRHLDLDGDGDTDSIDAAILLSNFNTQGSPDQGDIDGDGVIDSDDMKSLLHWGLGYMWNPADIDEDKDVDGADFLQWQRQLGNGFLAVEAPGAHAAPEPAPVVLALAAFVFLMFRQRLSATSGKIA